MLLRRSMLRGLTHAGAAAAAFCAACVAISTHPRSVRILAVVVMVPFVVPLIRMLHAAIAANQAVVSIAASIRSVLYSAIPTDQAMIAIASAVRLIASTIRTASTIRP